MSGLAPGFPAAVNTRADLVRPELIKGAVLAGRGGSVSVTLWRWHGQNWLVPATREQPGERDEICWVGECSQMQGHTRVPGGTGTCLGG